MFRLKYSLLLILIFASASCSVSKTQKKIAYDKTAAPKQVSNSEPENITGYKTIDTKHTEAEPLMQFAENLLGVKYKYGSTEPEKGFDCSGFVNYVFNHFNINVPRVSKDFNGFGPSVDLKKSKRGDIILFTGTDVKSSEVGHLGLITQNQNGQIKFIHSSSGRSIGVIISDLSNYYTTHFVKVIRVFDNSIKTK